MILDKNLFFSDGQTLPVTASAATASETIVDMGLSGDDVLDKLFIYVGFKSGAAAGLTVGLKTGTELNSSGALAGTLTTYTLTPTALAVAAGKKCFFHLPHANELGLGRYWQLVYTMGGTAATTAPVVHAMITDNRQTAPEALQ